MRHFVNKVPDYREKELPQIYRFNQLTRVFVLILALFIIIYAFWVIIFKLTTESPRFYKIVPFLMIFLAINTIFRNIFALNSVILTKSLIHFKYIGKKTIRIKYDSIKKISLSKTKLKAVIIEYSTDYKKSSIVIILSFPYILEIINWIAILSNDVEYDDFFKSVIVNIGKKREI